MALASAHTEPIIEDEQTAVLKFLRSEGSFACGVMA